MSQSALLEAGADVDMTSCLDASDEPSILKAVRNDNTNVVQASP